MRLEIDNLVLETELIGGFKINNHEYAVCFYIDSDNNSKIVIVEVIRNGNEVQTRNIPSEEVDFVLARYKEIEEKMLIGEMNE